MPDKTITTLPLLTIIERLLDSRLDTVGDEVKPKSLVETFWLNELEKAWRELDMDERRKMVGAYSENLFNALHHGIVDDN